MKHFKIFAAGLFAAVILLGSAAAAAPAQAITIKGNIKLCNSHYSITDMKAWKTDSSYSNWLYAYQDECTGWQPAPSMRMDTDPTGDSHSYKIKTVKENGSYTWSACHTNSDNHASDPPNPPTSENWVIWYVNYDHGYCNNY